MDELTPTPPLAEPSPAPSAPRKVPKQTHGRTRGQALTPDQREQIDHLIRQQAVSGLTDQAIADLLGVDRSTVKYRRKLVAAKVRLAESSSDDRTAIAESLGVADMPTASSVDSAEEPLTPEASLRILSLVARSSPNANAQVAAIRALETLRVQLLTPAKLGPPDPMTEDEKIAEVAAIIEAVGPSIVRKALDRVWQS